MLFHIFNTRIEIRKQNKGEYLEKLFMLQTAEKEYLNKKYEYTSYRLYQ